MTKNNENLKELLKDKNNDYSKAKLENIFAHKKINSIAILLQCLLLVITIILAIISIFINKFLYITEISMSFLLFIIAYNNSSIYKRKSFSVLYVVIGILILISSIWGLINGI